MLVLGSQWRWHQVTALRYPCNDCVEKEIREGELQCLSKGVYQGNEMSEQRLLEG